MNDSIIFKPGVLNIFTDASITPLGNNTWDGCSGAIVVNEKGEVIDQSLLVIRKCTNNIAELMAINTGVDLALSYIGKVSRINLFSDSKISVLGLRDWLWSWLHNYQGNDLSTLRTSSGTPVKNSHLIVQIINKITGIDYKTTQFNIYHCKGHAKGKEFVVQSTFREVNHIDIPIEDARRLGIYNDMIDVLTRDTLLSNTRQFDEVIPPFAIAPMNLSRYKKIIGARSF